MAESVASLEQCLTSTQGKVQRIRRAIEDANHDAAIVVNLLISKLDPDTRKAWEATVDHGDLPVYADTIDFLRNHCYMLERCEDSTTSGKSRATNVGVKSSTSTVPVKSHTAAVQHNRCLVCDNDHPVETCDVFKKLSINGRYAKAKQCGLCFACLKKGHRTANCKIDTSKLCECQKKHHPLMHYEEKQEKTETALGKAEMKSAAVTTGPPKESPQIVASCEVPVLQISAQKQVLLATAVVDVIDSSGVAHRCRALLDSGAMANFLSQKMSDLLLLPKDSVDIPVVGVNDARMIVKFRVSATVMSRTTDCVLSLDFLIVPRVTAALPAMQLDASDWPIPNQLQLADPNFSCTSRVDMLIGAEVFYELMESGKIRMTDELPLLQESRLGWLVAGSVNADRGVSSVKVCQAAINDRKDDELNMLLERFWMVDEQINEPSSDACEKHFLASYSRAKDGREAGDKTATGQKPNESIVTFIQGNLFQLWREQYAE
nr:uncharacterized protein LOC109399035 [Aedes albopictus]